MLLTKNKKLTFKNNAPFKSCISKINKIFIGNAENIDIVMPMYKLLKYSNNYSSTSGSLWNYYRDEVNNSANQIVMQLILGKQQQNNNQ